MRSARPSASRIDRAVGGRLDLPRAAAPLWTEHAGTTDPPPATPLEASSEAGSGRARTLAWVLLLAVVALFVVVRFVGTPTSVPRLPAAITLR
jgi:hypothetical protein